MRIMFITVIIIRFGEKTVVNVAKTAMSTSAQTILTTATDVVLLPVRGVEVYKIVTIATWVVANGA